MDATTKLYLANVRMEEAQRQAATDRIVAATRRARTGNGGQPGALALRVRGASAAALAFLHLG